MALAEFKLENLPRRVQIAIVAALVIGLVALAYFFSLKNLITNRTELREEVLRLELAVSEAAAVERRLADFKSELAALDARLEDLRRILPNQKETPEVLRTVQQMASESNLKIVKFVPQPVAPHAFYSDWPIAMELEGSYNALGRFFEKIGGYARIVNVDNISIKGIEGSTDRTRTLTSNCTATTFVFREGQNDPSGNN